MIYLTSDFHFGHNKEFIYKARGYDTIEQMNRQLFYNFNKIVTNADDVYILGDLIMGDSADSICYIKSLHGSLHIICGNHDTNNRQDLYRLCSNVCEICTSKYLKISKQHFYLSHFPTLTANHDNKPLKQSIINLCGHAHTKDPFLDWDKGLIYHVEVDAHNNKPISIEKIIKDINQRSILK